MDLSGHSLGAHSLGGGGVNGAAPTSTKSMKSGLDKSTKSVLGQVLEHAPGPGPQGQGQGKTTKLRQSSNSTNVNGDEDDDEDDPIIASNTYTDAPHETASFGGMISSFMKNGFSSMIGSNTGSSTTSGMLNTPYQHT